MGRPPDPGGCGAPRRRLGRRFSGFPVFRFSGFPVFRQTQKGRSSGAREPVRCGPRGGCNKPLMRRIAAYCGANVARWAAHALRARRRPQWGGTRVAGLRRSAACHGCDTLRHCCAELCGGTRRYSGTLSTIYSGLTLLGCAVQCDGTRLSLAWAPLRCGETPPVQPHSGVLRRVAAYCGVYWGSVCAAAVGRRCAVLCVWPDLPPRRIPA